MSTEDTIKRISNKLDDWNEQIGGKLDLVMRGVQRLTKENEELKKRALEDAEEIKASKRQKKEEDDDYIIVIVLSPQSHDIFSMGPDMHQCDQEDIETKVECYMIPVSDLGKPGTPFVHCTEVQHVRDNFYTVGDTGRYRVYDALNTHPRSVLDLSRGRHQLVFI